MFRELGKLNKPADQEVTAVEVDFMSGQKTIDKTGDFYAPGVYAVAYNKDGEAVRVAKVDLSTIPGARFGRDEKIITVDAMDFFGIDQ